MITYIHVPVPKEFFILSPAARLTWVGLCSFAAWKDGRFFRCFPGNTALVERTGLSRSTIKRAIHELVDAGFIIRRLRLKGKVHLTSECIPGLIFEDPGRTNGGPEGTKGVSTMDPTLVHGEPQSLPSNKTSEHYQGETEEAEETADLLFEEVVKLWNAILEPIGFPHHFATPLRAMAFHQRTQGYDERRKVAWWEGLFQRIANTPFLVRGVKEGAHWCDLDWLLREDNLVKVLEGRYEGENHPHIFRSRKKKDVVNVLDVESFVNKMMEQDPFWGGEDDDGEGTSALAGLS